MKDGKEIGRVVEYGKYGVFEKILLKSLTAYLQINLKIEENTPIELCLSQGINFKPIFFKAYALVEVKLIAVASLNPRGKATSCKKM